MEKEDPEPTLLPIPKTRTDYALREQQEVEELLERFRNETKGMRPFLPLGCLLPIGCVAGLFGVCSAGPPQSMMIVFGLGLAWLLLRQPVIRAKERTLARQLTEHSDIRLVGPLLEAFRWPEMDVQQPVRRALLSMLPRMKASDASMLGPEHRRTLHRVLSSADYALIEIVLKALEQVGNETSIRPVERLANRRVWWPEDRRIRDAARECLPSLRARLNETGHSLLRPTEAEDRPAETLLRSARITNHPAAEELLRAQPEEPHDAQDSH